MTIELGMERDIDQWMNLVEKVKDPYGLQFLFLKNIGIMELEQN